MTSPTRTAPRPVGRDQIIPAVIAAATRLFAERGPDTVSIREVAAEAGVNHALVHRHFGSKVDLVRLVVEGALDRVARAWPETPPASVEDLRAVVVAARQERDAVRVVAWALLAGRPVDDIVRRHPVAQRAFGLFAATRDEGRHATHVSAITDPRVAIAALAAMVLGWSVFEPWVDRASHLETVDGYRPDDALLEVFGVVLGAAGWPPAA